MRESPYTGRLSGQPGALVIECSCGSFTRSGADREDLLGQLDRHMDRAHP